MYKILLAEDEYIIREGLIKLVEWGKYGFEVIASAEDGDEAWQKFLDLSPDVVITDIKMPESNGIDLLKSIKAHTPEAIVLLLSGHDDFEYAQAGIRYGAFEYILKLNIMYEIDKTLERLTLEIDKQQKKKAERMALERAAGIHIQTLRGEAPELYDDIDKALIFIDNHFHEDINEAQAAGYAHLSPQYFSVKFKNKVGKGFAAYLRDKRLQEACHLLNGTDYLISDIAFAVGYPDVKYFYRVFKKAYKISPNDYRKQRRQPC